MSQRELKALQRKGIQVGDTVRTAYRGGVREGEVKQITQEPKVVFTRRRPGQKPKEVKHNPSTLEKVTPGMSDEDSEELAKARSAKARSSRGGSKGAAKRGAASRGGRGAQTKQEGAGKKPTGGKEAAAAEPGASKAAGRGKRAPAAASQQQKAGAGTGAGKGKGKGQAVAGKRAPAAAAKDGSKKRKAGTTAGTTGKRARRQEE